MKYKVFILISILFFLITLVACNSGGEVTPPIEDDNTNIEEPNEPSIPDEPVVPEVPKEEPELPKDESIEKPDEPEIEEPLEDDIDYENSIFAAPGSNGDGTIDNPYSLNKALQSLTTKKILYLLPGVYNMTTAIILASTGDTTSYFKIFAYKDEKVVLDFGKNYLDNLPLEGKYGKETSKGIVIKGSHYHLKGITITHAGAHGMQISGNYNIVENCVFAYNGNTGCNIGGSSSKPYSEWPHDNLIKNCTSYGNYDWDRLDNMQGEDADGFGCKLTTGPNNIFDGCIAYNNSDDGWDLFTKHLTGPIGSVTIKNSVAFSNGYSVTGESMKNGNGFKLGGRAIEVDHYVENCIAFFNKANGFDDNSNPGTITLKKCSSYKNGSRNYAMGRFLDENNTYTSTWYENNTLFGPVENVPKSHNIFEDCISYAGGITDSYSGTAKNCYFYSSNNKYLVFDSLVNCNSKYNKGIEKNMFMPFSSTDIDLDNLENIHYDYRNFDYSVNLKEFLKIKDEYNIGASLH